MVDVQFYFESGRQKYQLQGAIIIYQIYYQLKFRSFYQTSSRYQSVTVSLGLKTIREAQRLSGRRQITIKLKIN